MSHAMNRGVRMMLSALLMGAACAVGGSANGADPADGKPSVHWCGYNVLSMFIKGGRPDVPAGQLRSLARFGFRNPQEFRGYGLKVPGTNGRVRVVWLTGMVLARSVGHPVPKRVRRQVG